MNITFFFSVILKRFVNCDFYNRIIIKSIIQIFYLLLHFHIQLCGLFIKKTIDMTQLYNRIVFIDILLTNFLKKMKK